MPTACAGHSLIKDWVRTLAAAALEVVAASTNTASGLLILQLGIWPRAEGASSQVKHVVNC